MENLINIVNNPWFFSSVAGIFGLYLVTLSVILAVWTGRDIKQRTNNALARFFAPVFVLVFGFAGFLPYLVLRPRQTFAERADERRDVLLLIEAAKKFECPQCFAVVDRDFAHCPSCNVEFKPVCECGEILNIAWKRCPYCATPVSVLLQAKKYVDPIPAVDLPTLVEPAIKAAKAAKKSARTLASVTVAASKLSDKQAVTEQKPKKARAFSFKLRFNRQFKAAKPDAKLGVKPAQKITESVPALASIKVAVARPAPAAPKAKRGGFGGLTAGFRRALAIKR
ncbi:MAG: zinc ribbon domain-containing protein [Candidatus Andersenbacteria bacterium]